MAKKRKLKKYRSVRVKRGKYVRKQRGKAKRKYARRRNPIYRSMKMETLEAQIKALKEKYRKDKGILKIKLFGLALKLPPSSILQKSVNEEIHKLFQYQKVKNPKPPALGTVWPHARIKIIDGDRWRTIGSAMDTPAAIADEARKLRKQGHRNLWVFHAWGEKELLSDNPCKKRKRR
jgi:hypothetical protein